MKSISMRDVIITVTWMLSVSVIGCHGPKESKVFTCGYVKQETEEVRRVYMKIRDLQKELQTIQLRFNEVHRELAQLRSSHPRTPHEAMQLPTNMRRAQQHVLALRYRGQILMREMRLLIRSAQVVTRGFTGEQIGSIYETLNLVAEGEKEMDTYVELGGRALHLLHREIAFN